MALVRGQKEKRTKGVGGERMSVHEHVEPFIVGSKQELRDKLADVLPRSEKALERAKVHRTPGSFLLEFAQGDIPWSEIVKRAEKGAACIDERIFGLVERAVTSHEGCGAAGLVHGLLKSSAEVRARFISNGIFTKQEIDNLLKMPSDETGKAWAKKLAKAVGLPYYHLGVDHGHHYAGVAVLDAVGKLRSVTKGGEGDKPYVVTVLKPAGEIDTKTSYRIAIQNGILAYKISRGGHSVIPGYEEKTGQSTKFRIAVVHDDRLDVKAFDAQRKLIEQEMVAAGQIDVDDLRRYDFTFVDHTALRSQARTSSSRR